MCRRTWRPLPTERQQSGVQDKHPPVFSTSCTFCCYSDFWVLYTSQEMLREGCSWGRSASGPVLVIISQGPGEGRGEMPLPECRSFLTTVKCCLLLLIKNIYHQCLGRRSEGTADLTCTSVLDFSVAGHGAWEPEQCPLEGPSLRHRIQSHCDTHLLQRRRR